MSRATWIRGAIVTAVVALIGCGPPPSGACLTCTTGTPDASTTADAGEIADAGNVADAGGTTDAGLPSDAGNPTDAGTVPDAGGINVIESTSLGADWSCPDRNSCVADYEAFITKAAAFGHPITQAVLDAQIAALDANQVALDSTVLTPDQLAARIIAGTNIGFLLQGIDARPTQVVTTKLVNGTDSIERDFLIIDPYVGTFKGILLTPKSMGPYPAVIAIHGHPDDAEIYRDSFHGKDFPSHGYAILMLTMRAMAIDASEHQISVDLLKGGFTLVGLRDYETLLGFKYLRYLDEQKRGVNGARIGLVGHSGGSSASDLTVRIEPRIKAYVSDNSVNWHRSDDWWQIITGNLEPYHCETVPALFPINEKIKDFSSSATPIKQVAYGTAQTTAGNQTILDFFDGILKH